MVLRTGTENAARRAYEVGPRLVPSRRSRRDPESLSSVPGSFCFTQLRAQPGCSIAIALYNAQTTKRPQLYYRDRLQWAMSAC